MSDTTLHKIAAALGLSISTVSRALKGHPDISVQTKKKVLTAAAKLNYSPNPNTVYNAVRSSHFIALFIPVTPSTYFQEFIHTANQLAEHADYSILVLPLTNNTVSTTAQIKFCKQNKVHGIIICQDPLQPTNPKFKKIKELGVPVIVVNGTVPSTGIHYFKEDIESMAGMVASKIVEQNKHQILAIFDEAPSVKTEQILNAFIDKVAALEKNVAVVYAASTPESKNICTSAIAEAKYDAIFCMNDALLIGAWQALEASAQKIPLFGISDGGGLPAILPQTVSYAHYSGIQSAKETLSWLLRVMQEKTPPTEHTLTMIWHQSKA
ncbi:MAG: LacI family transcriptional regulator [Bacteroidetes bacterium]|nr:LacI family transcriptional regulator [Bacteroidota bacterium]